MTNSREKGKRGEREAAQWLRDRGYHARRGQQYKGGPDAPDVITGLPVHIEVKRTERFRIHSAMEQSIDEAGDNEIPIVMYKSNRRPWLVILRAEDYFVKECEF